MAVTFPKKATDTKWQWHCSSKTSGENYSLIKSIYFPKYEQEMKCQELCYVKINTTHYVPTIITKATETYIPEPLPLINLLD